MPSGSMFHASISAAKVFTGGMVQAVAGLSG
jgi:hypothetical protein